MKRFTLIFATQQRNFAEMYVFRRPRLMRRNKCMENKRDSSSYNYSSLFPPSQDEHDEQRLNVMNAYESEVDRVGYRVLIGSIV